MLYFSLVASAMLLFIVNEAHFRKSSPTLTTVLAGAGLAVLPIFAMCVLPLVFLQAVALIVGCVAAKAFTRPARFFLVYSVLATVAVYGAATLHISADLTALRQKHPEEVLADRLPSGPPLAAPALLPKETATFLAQVDSEIDSGDSSWQRHARERTLRQIHDDKVRAFADSAGFGAARMPLLQTANLEAGLRQETSAPQPGPRDTWALSSELPAPPPSSLDTGPLAALHLAGLLDFVNPNGFGVALDRKRLLGFQSHHFSKAPTAPKWSVQTIDLVGLVLHKEPVVYVSDHLPRMNELRKGRTRPPDVFERAGLEALASGENLYVRASPQGLRMLGGVRSGESCTKCHDAERGALLGAFSYSLRQSDAN